MSNNKQQENEIKLINKAIEKSDLIKHETLKKSKDVENLIKIVENFLKNNDVLCYGGTAINNILPEKDQFYDYNVDIPDYDIYSVNALEDVKKLADLFFEKGYSNVDVRPAMNIGTYKLSVNFISVVDITVIDKQTFNAMKKEVIIIKNIKYTPVNYLRMSMYKELSRPLGDTSRWEKVYKRLVLLNKNYPLKNDFCETIDSSKNNDNELTKTLTDILINNGSVFIGDYAAFFYKKYMSIKHKDNFELFKHTIEIITDNTERDIKKIKNELENKKYKNIEIIERNPIGSIIDEHFQIVVDKNPICIIYKSKGCYNYNTIKRDNKIIKVATMDTIMTFLLGSIYTGRSYYNNEKIICVAQYMFNIMLRQIISNKGLLKRFSIDCIGNEQTLIDKLEEKSILFEKLKNNKKSKEYKKIFFRYNPKLVRENKTIKVKKTKNKENKKSKNKKSKKIKNKLSDKLIDSLFLL